MTNFKVTSKNRGAAKRILNVWFDAADVRTWTLAQLQDGLFQAVRDEMITAAAVHRALDDETRIQNNGQPGKAGEDGDDDTGTASGNDGGDDGDKGDAGDGAGNPADSDDDGDADDDSDSDPDSDSDGDDDADSDDEQPAPDMPPAPSADDVPPNMPFVTHDELNESNAKITTAMSEYSQQCALTVFDGTTKLVEKHAKQMRAQIAAIQKAQPQKARKLKLELPDGTKKTMKGTHTMLPIVLKYIAAGLNVALVGPAGTGKSTIVLHAAEALDREFRGTGALMSKYDLIGYKDANGTYHETPLYDAYTNGHLFCFDELDASAPDAVVAFNAVTDNQNVYAFPNGMKPKHEKFVAVACLNTWGNGASAEYVGRFKQDAAAMSRFVKVFIDYDAALEATLGDSDIVTRIHKVRKACEVLGIRHVVSTRMIVQAQAARDAGVSRNEIDRDIIFAGLDDAAIEQIKTGAK